MKNVPWYFHLLTRRLQKTFLKCSTFTQKTCQRSQWHRKCTFMPLNVLSTPVPFRIRNGIIWTLVNQGNEASKVNCCCVFSAFILQTSSLWAVFVNKKRYISVTLVSEEDKSIQFSKFCQEYFIDFLSKWWLPCHAVTSVLCLLYRPETVHWNNCLCIIILCCEHRRDILK